MFEFELEDILERYPLPDDTTDDIVNRELVAEALTKSVNRIDDYHRNKGMPVHAVGGNGTPYKFQLSHCWAWYHAWKDHESAEAERKRSNVRQLRLHLANDKDQKHAEMSPKERSAYYEAEGKWMQTAEFRQLFTHRANVILLLEAILLMFRNNMTSFPDLLERELGLSPDQVEEGVKLCDKQIEQIKVQIEESGLCDDESFEKTAQELVAG